MFVKNNPGRLDRNLFLPEAATTPDIRYIQRMQDTPALASDRTPQGSLAIENTTLELNARATNKSVKVLKPSARRGDPLKPSSDRFLDINIHVFP